MHPSRAARARRSGNRERQPLTTLGPARDDGQARLTVEVYLARHGETEWTVSGRHTGNTDLPLTPQGEENAAALRPRLAGIQFDAVYSSPLQRARRTAEIAGFPRAQVTPLFAEVDYGEYEGITTKAIHEQRPGWEIFKDGCPGGETPSEIYARAQKVVALFEGVSGRALAFAHGHILRAVAVAWLSLEVSVAAQLLLDVATISVLRHDERGRLLVIWNEH